MNQTFTVTAHMQATIEGSFTIRSYACNQSLFRMYRRWGESPFGETARIVSIETKEVIYSEEANSFQQPNQLVITSFCFPPSSYSVWVSHISRSFWDVNSTLSIRQILPSGQNCFSFTFISMQCYYQSERTNFIHSKSFTN